MCLNCQTGRRGFHCRSCIHHNIILLEIIHRSECWKCCTPYIYISWPMDMGSVREYVFFIDMKKGLATMGWGSRRIQYNTRYQRREKRALVQCQRPLPVLWFVIDIFCYCESRCKIPSLTDCVSFFIITQFDWEKLQKEIHLPTSIKEHLHEILVNFTRYTPLFDSL